MASWKKDQAKLLKLFEEMSSGSSNSEAESDVDGGENNSSDSEDNESTTKEEYEEPENDDTWHTNTKPIRNFSFDAAAAGILLDIDENVSPIQVFEKIWDDQVMEMIIKSTNDYSIKLCHQKRPHTRHSRQANFKNTDTIEMRKFLGLCLLQSQLKFASIRKLFSIDALHYHPAFPSQMSGRRFEQILKCFCVEEEENSSDPLRKIKIFLDLLIQKFANAYAPNEALSLDESMLLYRGRPYFRTYMKSKKAKHGIRFYELCSAQGYILNIEICKGHREKHDENMTTIESLVMRLMQSYLNKGHHLFLDNYYNSLQLSNKLLSKKTHVTGTLRVNSKGLPQEITRRKLRRGEHVWRRQNQIYVSKWKDKRDLLCLTTAYHPSMISTANRRQQEKRKPIEIVNYNQNMAAAYRADQMMPYYSCPRKTISWYKKVIFRLLDVAVWNSYYIFKEKTGSQMKFIEYREAIIRSLTGIDYKQDGRSLVQFKRARIQTNDLNYDGTQHFPEKISPPENYQRKTYFQRCKQCYKQGIRRETSYCCKNCMSKLALCPAPCFETWHTEKNV